jgi:uncharacterized protein
MKEIAMSRSKVALKKYKRSADEDGEVLNQQALAFYQQNELIRAVELWEEAAEQGHAGAQIHLGNHYSEEGVPDKAILYYEMAADQGDRDAQYTLGVLCSNGNNHIQAVRWWRVAAEQGHVEAQNDLAVAYRFGEGVEQSDVEAVKWWREAAEQGHSEAQNDLGDAYANGVGVAKNDVEAVKWWQRAAEEGNHAAAQYSMGKACANGEGIGKDYVKTTEWYRRSADQGNADAQNALGEAYIFSEGVEKNIEEALQWFQRAADQGHENAIRHLGELYTNGGGVEKNEEEAARWYRRSADLGEIGAQYFLGNCYYEGKGVKKDTEEAGRWWMLAAGGGHDEAINILKQHREAVLKIFQDSFADDLYYQENQKSMDDAIMRFQEKEKHICPDELSEDKLRQLFATLKNTMEENKASNLGEEEIELNTMKKLHGSRAFSTLLPDEADGLPYIRNELCSKVPSAISDMSLRFLGAAEEELIDVYAGPTSVRVSSEANAILVRFNSDENREDFLGKLLAKFEINLDDGIEVIRGELHHSLSLRACENASEANQKNFGAMANVLNKKYNGVTSSATVAMER